MEKVPKYEIIIVKEDVMKDGEITSKELNDIALARLLNIELLDLFSTFCKNKNSKNIECLYEAYILLTDKLSDIYRRNRMLLSAVEPKALFQIYPDLFQHEEEAHSKQKRLLLYQKRHIAELDLLWAVCEKPTATYDNKVTGVIEVVRQARANLVIGSLAINDNTPMFRLSYNDIKCKIMLDEYFEVSNLQFDNNIERTISKAFRKPNKSVKAVADMVQFKSRVKLPDELKDLFFQASNSSGRRFSVNKIITVKMLRDNRLDPKKIDKQIVSMYGLITDI